MRTSSFCSNLQTHICASVIVLFLTHSVQCQWNTKIELWNGKSTEMVSGSAILRLKTENGIASLDSLFSKYSISIVREYSSLKMYFLVFPESLSVVSICNDFNANPSANHCCPNFVGYPLIDDTYWDCQWGFKNTGQQGGGTAGADMMVEEAFAIARGSSMTRIAILDSGIPFDDVTHTLNHPDLANPQRIEIGCICYTENPQTINDLGCGHGTLVAGIALGEANDYGIVGVCPQCTGVIQKFAPDCNSTAETMCNGIWDAETRNIDILNLSYFWEEDENLTAVIDEAGIQFGILFIVSCGNFYNDNCTYPANLAATRSYVMAIAGTNPNDRLWRSRPYSDEPCMGSCYGPGVTVAAPAGGIAHCPATDDPLDIDIVSDRNVSSQQQICGNATAQRVRSVEGTSFAAPAVAGLAGLIRSLNPQLTITDIRTIIEQSADAVYGNELSIPNDSVGYGRVNAFKALLLAPGNKTLINNLHIRKHIYDAESPYVLRDDLIVPAGKMLFMDPGVRILFESDARIVVEGRIVVNGTEQNPVVFDRQGTEGFWGGIRITSDSLNELEHVVIRHARNGVIVMNGNAALDAVTVEDCERNGVAFRNSSGTITNCTLTDNGIHGAYLIHSKVVMDNNLVSTNDVSGIKIWG